MKFTQIVIQIKCLHGNNFLDPDHNVLCKQGITLYNIPCTTLKTITQTLPNNQRETSTLYFQTLFNPVKMSFLEIISKLKTSCQEYIL